jgi:hypothetical protein
LGTIYKDLDDALAKRLEEKRADLARGWEWGPHYTPTFLHYPDLDFGVLSEDDRSYVEHACYETICASKENQVFFEGIEDILEFCQLLAQPENHILVPSGQYVEKPVQIASTSEMTNQAVQTLTGLPKFTAYAKIIDEREGKQTSWAGKIETRDFQFPQQHEFVGQEEQAVEQTRRSVCKPRSVIQGEIINRRTDWRKSAAPTVVHTSSPPEKDQQDPPSPWA